MKCCETAVLNCMQREKPICWIMMDLDYRYLFLLIVQQFYLRMSSRAISWRSDTSVLPYFKVAWESFLVQLMGILWRIFSVCLEKESHLAFPENVCAWFSRINSSSTVVNMTMIFYSCEHDKDIPERGTGSCIWLLAKDEALPGTTYFPELLCHCLENHKAEWMS